MDSIFKLSRSGLTDLIVTGLEFDNDEYLDENLDTLVSVRNYAYSHSVTVNILSHISIGDPKIKTHSIVEHLDGCTDESIFKMDEDGLYEVAHIIIPNKKWFDYCTAFGDKSGLDNYQEIYIYDETESKIVKHTDDGFIDCSIEELLKANSEDKINPSDLITTVIKSEKSTFNIYYIRKCHADICSKILNAQITSCKTDSHLSQEIFKRDVLFMAINSIKFAIDTLQFFEAHRILESIKSCVNLCTTDTSYYKCNCNKYGPY